MSFNDLETFVPEQRESRAVESSSNIFSEAYDFNPKSFQSDSLKTTDSSVDLAFGTLDLFDSATNDTRDPVSFDRGGSGTPGPRPGVMETVTKTLEAVPDQLGRTLGAIGDAWSHPGAVIDEAAENARIIFQNIRDGK